jgi:hypothetical protein
MGKVTYNLIQINGNSNQQPDPKLLEQFSCWLLFHYFGSGCWSLFLLFWNRLLVTVPIMLDQAVGYCSNHFGSEWE